MEPAVIPVSQLAPDPAILNSIHDRPEVLAYFLCNVGDGDAQVVILPADANGKRRVVVVDAGRVNKVPSLLHALDEGLGLSGGPEPFVALVVATHPHDDHMAGLPQLLTTFRGEVGEFWDPGYYHTIDAYHDAMTAIEHDPQVLYANPTSGFRRWIGDTVLTVLSPSILLRNRFDSYGIELNDSSISLKVEFPARRVEVRDEERVIHDRVATRTLILGGDAQTLSWSYVLTDFPFLRQSTTPAAEAIEAATSNIDLLRADVLKVSHHASKNGVNLELVQRIDPSVTLVSSDSTKSQWNFPHTVTQELIREALVPIATKRPPPQRRSDWEIKLFYTCDRMGDDVESSTALGSIALLIGPNDCRMWRFQDAPGALIDFGMGLRWKKNL